MEGSRPHYWVGPKGEEEEARVGVGRTDPIVIKQIRILRTAENVQRLHDAILRLKEVVDRLATCESLVDAGELEKALPAAWMALTAAFIAMTDRAAGVTNLAMFLES